MDKTISLRNAIKKDITFLSLLREQTMKTHLEKGGIQYDQQQQIERIKASFAHAKIIMKENKDIGLLKMDKSAIPWKLIQIQLLPEYQNNGIGFSLLNSIIEEAEAASVSVELSVLRKNPALGLYLKVGFRIVLKEEHSFIMRYEN